MRSAVLTWPDTQWSCVYKCLSCCAKARRPLLGFEFSWSLSNLKMMRMASSTAAAVGGNLTPVLVPRRSQRKRVLEAHEEESSVRSRVTKKLFKSSLDVKELRKTADIKHVIFVKKEVKNEVLEVIKHVSRKVLPGLPQRKGLAEQGQDVKKEVIKSKVLEDVKRVSRKVLPQFPKLEDVAEVGQDVKNEVELDCWAKLGFGEWCGLGVGRAELCLDVTLPVGQSFRWKVTGQSQYTGVVGPHLITLRQVGDEVEFLHHASSRETAGSLAEVERDLREYLNLHTSLVDLYAQFSAADVRFAEVAPFIAGARLLRQPPLECLFQFICSSNNHIQRIASMVEYLASQGTFLGSLSGIRFHVFPSLEQLAPVTESQLRENGFGYRAKYIVGTTELLRQKVEGGEQWLLSLRKQSLEDAVLALCTLPGIGPKVAACIALFSLDQHHAIPVDTHVWQIAVRYLLPNLEGQKLTLKLHREVADAFVERFGSYAGWAHTVLFISELSSKQNLLPKHLRVQKVPKAPKVPNAPKVPKAQKVPIQSVQKSSSS